MLNLLKKNNKPVGRPRKVIAAPVQEEEIYEGPQEPSDYAPAPQELPTMPEPKIESEPSPITRDEILDLVEANIARQIELIRYARQLK